MSWTFMLSNHHLRWCFFKMHDIEPPLTVVESKTFITFRAHIRYDGALTGQMSNPPVLHSSEGQKNEKPGSVVSHCWPWLQVIKALLSFCQSSDSPNISPWLISAVSSVRAYTKPWKDQHPVPVFAIHLSIPSSLKKKKKRRTRSSLISSFSGLFFFVSPQKVRSSVSVRAVESARLFRTDRKLRNYCTFWWASYNTVKRCFCSKHCHFWSPGSTPWTLNYRPVMSPSCHLSNSPPLVHPLNEDGHPEVWWRGFGPATGLQVSCGRLGGVRLSRMMGWLIQQHLRSTGRDFSHSHTHSAASERPRTQQKLLKHTQLTGSLVM